MAVREFDPAYLLTSLNNAFDTGPAEFSWAVKRHFAAYVPPIYNFQLPDIAAQRNRAQRFLFDPLEQFICQSIHPESVFNELKAKDGTPVLCGKAFRNGEPTYSCRDCAMDPTCVFCMQCFDRSVHKTHKYRISTSGGGGYCDCGDAEAWRDNPSCDLHKQTDSQKAESSAGAMAEDMRQRCEATLSLLMHHAYSMLTWQNGLELPEPLQVEDTEPVTYVTMLFNDEVHTYDQVISTLERAINCTHKEAIDFATTVDREGRSPVLCSTQEDCTRVAGIIEKRTKIGGTGRPLKVEVMSSAVAAHQQFAQDILSWLHSLIEKSDAIRSLFCKLAMDTESHGDALSILEKMLLNDTNFWKVVRQKSHELFMAGVFTDMHYKCQFAILFTKHYGRIYHDFARDDHYRTVSVTSVSVQIYTVTTIAKVLIAKHNLIEVIMQTLLEESKHKVNVHGQFEFSRQQSDFLEFKRVQYAFSDLKYALSSAVPGRSWDDELRGSFLRGLQAFCCFLQRMQGMDAVIRQTKSHVEYEPEWETAFNIHIKLEDCITLMLEWCGFDKKVLLKACQAVFTLVESTGVADMKRQLASAEGCEIFGIDHSVARDPVSIHLPLTRFLGSLLLHLDNFGIPFGSLWSDLSDGMDVVSFMECSLQVQVLMAQAQAGMWKRNGIALVSQLHYYHNIRFRREMYDKDIVVLQIAAAMLNNNQFLLHLLAKFDLLKWLDEGYEVPGTGDNVVQTIVLAEEFLGLLITIIGERFMEGVGRVTKDEIIRHEIVHQLALGRLTHSDLEQNLPDHLSTEVGIEENIRQVAVFQKKGESGKGMYELRPEKHQEVNPNYYHYSKAEQSKVEEYHQRSSREMATSERDGCVPAGFGFPTPVPPQFCDNFEQVVGLLRSDVMLRIMRTVLERMVTPRSRSRSDAQCEKVLHLITLGLHEDNRLYKDYNDSAFPFLTCITAGGPGSIISLVASAASAGHATQEPTKELLQWTLSYVHLLEHCRSAGIGVQHGSHNQLVVDSASGGLDADVRLLQEKRQRTEKASKSKQKMIDKMARLQKKFLKENSSLLNDPLLAAVSQTQDMDTSEYAGNDDRDSLSLPAAVAVGSKHTTASPAIETHTCIVCQEETTVTVNSQAFVYLAYIQRSSVLSQQHPTASTRSTKHRFMPVDLPVGTYISTCGHTMHTDCRQRYFDSVSARERRRLLALRFLRYSDGHEVDEFLCPLCATIGNTVMPVIPPLTLLKNGRDPLNVHVDFGDWLGATAKIISASVQMSASEPEDSLLKPCPLPELAQAIADSAYAKLTELYRMMNAPTEQRGTITDEVLQMMRKLGDDIITADPDAKAKGTTAHVAMWNACAFTIQVLEQVLRSEGRPLFGNSSLSSRQQSCLVALVRCAATAQQASLAAVVRQCAVQVMSGLLGIVHETPGQPTSSTAQSAEYDVLSLDLWHFFVSACLSLPALYSDKMASSVDVFTSAAYSMGGVAEQHLLRVVLVAHVVQVLLRISAAPAADSAESFPSAGGPTDPLLLDVVDKIYCLMGVHLPCGRADPIGAAAHLEEHLKHACLPFLRCAALFFSVLTDVSPASGISYDSYESICCYLGLSTQISSLFTNNQVEIMELIKKWCIAYASANTAAPSSVALLSVSYPLTARPLIDLPHDYSQLINKASTFTCRKTCGADDSRSPTLCLVCGEMVCSQSYCCQVIMEGTQHAVGAATAHAQLCGSGTCVFLRVRQCQVLMLTGQTKGCLSVAPYVDEYGETDQGLRRGKPLYLCNVEYKKLQRWWLHHSIPEVVSHSLETRHSGMDWQHL